MHSDHHGRELTLASNESTGLIPYLTESQTCVRASLKVEFVALGCSILSSFGTLIDGEL